VIPPLGRSRPTAMDGRMVWPKNGRASGITAVERNGAVPFSGITGSHTFAWGNFDHRD
jgi:hypothetical protein